MPFLNDGVRLESRVLPATITYQGQGLYDHVGPDAGVGPDNVQDLKFNISNITKSISNIEVTGPSGFKWVTGPNKSGVSHAMLVSGATGSQSASLYINPVVRNNATGTFVSGSATGSLTPLAQGNSITVKINYSDTTTQSGTFTLSTLAAQPVMMPALTTQQIASNVLTVEWKGVLNTDSQVQGRQAGDVHLEVANLNGTNLDQSLANTVWVLSSAAGDTWYYTGSNSSADNYMKVVKQSGDPTKADVYFTPRRDDSKQGNFAAPEAPKLTLTARNAPDNSTLYVSEFEGKNWWNPSLITDALNTNPSTTQPINSESSLRTALLTGGTYSLSTGATIVIRQPLEIKNSVKIVGNDATILFDQGSTANWPADIRGAIYVKSHQSEGSFPRRLHIEFSDFSIKFNQNAAIRWANYNSTPEPLWNPAYMNYVPKAVISLAASSSTVPWDGLDSRSRDHIILNDMDIAGPPAFYTGSGPTAQQIGTHTYVGEPAVPILMTNTYDWGEITNSTFQGGSLSVQGGPWTITDNIVKGSIAGTFSPSAFSVHESRDLTLRNNHVYQLQPAGRVFRLVNLANSGVNDVVEGNTFDGGGGSDGNEATYQLDRYGAGQPGINGPNNPEVILTEVNAVGFEGSPRAVSPDGRLVTVPSNIGSVNDDNDGWDKGRFGAGWVASIIASPGDPSLVGRWSQISHMVSHTANGTATFLMQQPLPPQPSGGYTISISKGFVNELISNNEIDITGKSSTAIQLPGANFGTRVVSNEIVGGTVFRNGYTGTGIFVSAFLVNASPWLQSTGTTYYPAFWTHNPSFGVQVTDNTVINSTGGIQARVTHYPTSYSSAFRTYVEADIKNNNIFWERAFRDSSTNSYLVPAFPTVTVGSIFAANPNAAPNPWYVGNTTNGFVDPAEISLVVEGNTAAIRESNGTTLTPAPQPAGQIYAGYVNSTRYGSGLSLPAPYNYQNLDINGTQQTIDDANTNSASFSRTGTWTYTTNDGFLDDYSVAGAAGPTATATWTFDNLTPGRYRVFVTWPGSQSEVSDRATNAPFAVWDDTTELRAFRINQQKQPNGAVDNGRRWEQLGGDDSTFDIATNKLKVTLGNSGNGKVMADAVRIERVGDLLIIDDGEPGFTTTGAWSTATGSGFTNDYRYVERARQINGSGNNTTLTKLLPTATATWTFDGLTPGRYRVWTKWIKSNDRSPDIPYTIFDGSTALKTVRVDQYTNLDDRFGVTVGGWEALGGTSARYDVTGSQLKVVLTNAATRGASTPLNNPGYVGADAVWIERMEDLAVDDSGIGSNVGFELSSDAWEQWPNYSGYGGDHSTVAKAPGSVSTEWAKWTFNNLIPGTYEVRLKWVYGSDTGRATDAPYTFFDGSTSLGTVRVNQREEVNAAGVVAYDYRGRSWLVLDDKFVVSGSQFVIRLDNNADGKVVADAVEIRRTGPLKGDEDDGFVSYTEATAGAWHYWSGSGHNGDHATIAVTSGASNASATWTFDGISPGQYEVQATWPYDSNRATNVPYTVKDGTRPAFTPVPVNQKTTPAGGWLTIGTYDFRESRVTVRLDNNASGGTTVVADSVRLVRKTPALIDDGSAYFSQQVYAVPGYASVQWTSYDSPSTPGYNHDHRVADAAGGGKYGYITAAAFWTFEGLTPGNYRVWAKWVYDGGNFSTSNRAIDAPYTVYDGTVELAEIRVDQRRAPDDPAHGFAVDYRFGGGALQLGSSDYVITGTQLRVLIANNVTSGKIVADAVYIERIS